MTIRAVAFDIGGVLERVAPQQDWLDPWRERLGLGPAGFASALARVDPDGRIGTGALTEAAYRQRFADALGLSSAQTNEFMADMWSWYCGELDQELMTFAASLRPRCATAILSNSADGARREEQARHSFAEAFDVIIYSHEVGLVKPDSRIYALLCAGLNVPAADLVFLDDMPENVEAACRFGIRGILHRNTAESIAAIDALLAG
jgi:epoxide hydrolase-like predicted phosphatase